MQLSPEAGAIVAAPASGDGAGGGAIHVPDEFGRDSAALHAEEGGGAACRRPESRQFRVAALSRATRHRRRDRVASRDGEAFERRRGGEGGGRGR